MGHSLGSVQHHQRTGPVGPAHDFRHRVDGPENVRDPGQRQNLGIVGQRRVQAVEVEGAVGVHLHPAQSGFFAQSQLLPGDEVGMVLHHGQRNGVARTDVLGQAAGQQIDRFGGAAGEDAAFGGGADKAGYVRPSSLVSLGRFHRQTVGPPVHVGTAAGVVVLDGVQHRSGLLAGRGAVEEDRRLRPGQIGEILRIDHRRSSIAHRGTDPFPPEVLTPPAIPGSRAGAGADSLADSSRSGKRTIPLLSRPPPATERWWPESPAPNARG